MATTKNNRPQAGRDPMTYGLLANGVSGAWSIDVDETMSGPDRWFLRIEGPAAYFSFEIPSLDIVERLGEFLAARPAQNGRPTGPDSGSDWELTIGTDPRTPVHLLRDDEFVDRFFLLVGGTDAWCVRYTLVAEDVKCLVTALSQVREDLPTE